MHPDAWPRKLVDPIGGEMFEAVMLVEAYASSPCPSDLLEEVVRILLADLRQNTAALIVNDKMVHVSRA